MKKYLTLLLLVTAILTNKLNAQNTTPCNAAFTVQAISNFTYKFTPAIVTDSPFVQHHWVFGDGTPPVTTIISTHTYANPGTYTVKHYIERHTPNGVYICSDSVSHVINIYLDCNIQANYSSVIDSANQRTVHFFNQTVNFNSTDSIRWTFGDGAVSYALDPTHTYANFGTYNACLRIKRNANTPGTTPCISEFCKMVTLTQPTACTLHIAFSSHADSLLNTKIYFTNLSTPVTSTDSIRWTFGDGTSSNHLSPDHTYAIGGTYTACLRIIKREQNGALTSCIKDTCKTIVVQDACNLTASFVSHKDSLATSPYTYYFQNTSIPAATTDSIRWTFGDGTFSNIFNPTHTYLQPGTYNVCLRVQKRNTAGILTNCVGEICHTIIVEQVCNLHPNYTWAKDSINNRKIYFTNLTAGANTNIIYTWSFGDGTTATSYNATHEYAQPGRYYVCLKAVYGNCTSYKCDSITVNTNSPACTQLSNYTFVKSSTDNQTYTFKPDYIGTDILYTWTFGDGTGNHDAITTHHFATSNTYTVCLTAFRNINCASTTCKTISVLPQINCDNVQVSFNDSRDSLFPNRITFTANSSQLILDQVWTITRTTVSGTPIIIHSNNPTYIFPDTGYYNVCLKATTVGGCIKTVCKTFHITQLGSNACELQAYPNPTTNTVNVNVSLSQPQTIYAYVYNSINVLVLTKTQAGFAGSNILTVNTANLTSGLYTIKLVYGDHVCYARFQKL